MKRWRIWCLVKSCTNYAEDNHEMQWKIKVQFVGGEQSWGKGESGQKLNFSTIAFDLMPGWVDRELDDKPDK